MSWGDCMERMISEAIETLIGDTPVSEQLGAALSHVAHKDHVHENYVTRTEYETLKKQVDMLLELVGDLSVSEQINAAINAAKG